MSTTLHDIRQAARQLRTRPGFAVLVVAILALGIGANTAIFSVVRAVLLRPLPYGSPDRLVVVWAQMERRNVDKFPLSPWLLREAKERTRSLSDVAGVVAFQQALTGIDGEPEQVVVGGPTPNLFSVLGVAPALGRDFVPADGGPAPPPPGAPPGGAPATVAILSDGLWQRRFGGDPDVLGRTIELGGATVEVVGVMPPGFRLHMPPGSGVGERVDVWAPPHVDVEAWPRNNVIFTGIGRLAPGATAEQARAELRTVARRLRDEDRSWESAGLGFDAIPMQREVTAHVRPLILALLGAVAFLLLIACANVSNLFLVRATERGREMSVRAALGAGRPRLVRQVLLEAGVLALLGGLAGLLVALGGIELLLALQPEELPRLSSVGIDGSVLAFTLAASLAAALVAGLAPALQSSRVQLADSLKARGDALGRGAHRWLRNGVVVVEVTLALVLLIGAGLMVRSFVSLQRVQPGYDPEGVLTFAIDLPLARYPEAGERSALAGLFRERLEALPGVESAAGAFPIPLQGIPFNGRYGTEEALQDPDAFRQADYRVVTPGYFETLRTRLLAGRTFTPADEADSAAVVVVDETLAAATWPGEDAVGRPIWVRLTGAEPERLEVVGVVEHQRAEDLAADGRETIYFPYRYAGAFGNVVWLARTRGEPEALVGRVRETLAGLDPLIPLADVRTMEAVMAEARAPTRFALVLMAVFAAVALALAAVGLYGVLAYAVRQRTSEIGVRMAFGASTGSVLRLVLRQGLLLTGIGVAAGLLLSLGVTRTLESLLVGVSPTDPLTFAGIAALFLGIAALACWLPALGATRVDPLVALKGE